VYSNVIFLFPTVDLIERTQRYEIYSLLLSVCMVAMAFKAVFKVFERVCGYDVNCHSQMLANSNVVACLKFYLLL